MSRTAKSVAAVAAALTVTALPLLGASPAQATPGDCVDYLIEKGHGQEILLPCYVAVADPEEAESQLLSAGVSPTDVEQAIGLAQQ
jgi:hypothetical protein